MQTPALPPLPVPGQVIPMKKSEAKKSAPKRPVVEVDPEEVAKLVKLLGDEVYAEMQSYDHAELRNRVVALSEHEVETEQAMKKDEKLAELREAAKHAQDPYKETIKFLKARRRLAVLLMAERGRPVS
jgi:hypothetical protein